MDTGRGSFRASSRNAHAHAAAGVATCSYRLPRKQRTSQGLIDRLTDAADYAPARDMGGPEAISNRTTTAARALIAVKARCIRSCAGGSLSELHTATRSRGAQPAV